MPLEFTSLINVITFSHEADQIKTSTVGFHNQTYPECFHSKVCLVPDGADFYFRAEAFRRYLSVMYVWL